MILITRYAEGFLGYAKETIGFEQGLEELKKVKGVTNYRFGKIKDYIYVK